jgi:hypothetical protein
VRTTRRPWAAALILAVSVVALALALAACSGSVNIGTSSSPEPAGPVTYTDPTYGYSITYDGAFTKGKAKDSASAGGDSASDVIFADENGTVASDTYLDAIKVSVYDLARSVKPAEVPKLEKELQGIVDEVLASLKNAKVVEPLTAVEVNGVPGFKTKYTFDDLGKQLTMASVFLFKDAHEYQVSTQSVTERWDELQDKFESAVQSFTAK